MSSRYRRDDDRRDRSKQPHDGDWICPESRCAANNFARRDKCHKCGLDRPRGIARIKVGGVELGKEMAEKSKGLFSADDWQCKSCGNVNWARRDTCNVCNAPKVGHAEERTGFGGGFMERDENPEKIQRDSDDEEYDEFGRRKKKYRQSVTGLASRENSRDDRSSDDEPAADDDDDEEREDDEEEEEESGDEDLSKYDFGDFGDDDDKKEDSPKERRRERSDRKSRSRSRSPL